MLVLSRKVFCNSVPSPIRTHVCRSILKFTATSKRARSITLHSSQIHELPSTVQGNEFAEQFARGTITFGLATKATSSDLFITLLAGRERLSVLRANLERSETQRRTLFLCFIGIVSMQFVSSKKREGSSKEGIQGSWSWSRPLASRCSPGFSGKEAAQRRSRKSAGRMAAMLRGSKGPTKFMYDLVVIGGGSGGVSFWWIL